MVRFCGLLGCVSAWLATASVALAACLSDTDGDGVCDDVDLCPGTVPGAVVDADGCPPVIPGDHDRDGDVDADDFAFLWDCQSGPGVAAGAACPMGEFDFDLDADVDLADVRAFQRCFSGTDQPADAECALPRARIEGGCLEVLGTAGAAPLALRLQAGASNVLEVDFGADGSADSSFDRAQFDCIVVRAGGGDDLVWIDELNGIFTDAELTTIDGGHGNDTLVGGSGAETFRGGPGDDFAHLGAGDDILEWGPGEGSDLVEGGDGADTVQVNGGDEAEDFAISANGSRVRFDGLSPAPFFLDIGGCENLVLNANGGDDTANCTGNLAALIRITFDGGAGDDILQGSNGPDVLIGGDGNDLVDGQQGDDVVFLGAGNDVFQWDPGDGSDVVEGQAGYDAVRFNASGANEVFDSSANGRRLRFARNVGSVILDADGVEQFDLQALGGTDVATVNDLSGTDVVEVNIDLAGTLGGSSGDGQPDHVVVNATEGADAIDLTASVGAVVVRGLAAITRISRPEAANDQLMVNGLGGADTITPGPGVAALITLIING